MYIKLGGTGLIENKLKWIIGTHGHWKNQNPGGRPGATSQTALPIQPIWPIFLVDRLNWQCCLAGSSKMAPRILIFSMAMGADCSFWLISIETCAPQYKRLNKSFLGSVNVFQPTKCRFLLNVLVSWVKNRQNLIFYSLIVPIYFFLLIYTHLI